ncbi:hypothetical protein [Roseibium sp. LAB1]
MLRWPTNRIFKTGAARSVYDGRYRFNRYFSPLNFNTPTTLDALFRDNDVELYDLEVDPQEVDNLAMDRERNADLILSLNTLLNDLIADEVGTDDGGFLPIRDGRWYFPPKYRLDGESHSRKLQCLGDGGFNHPRKSHNHRRKGGFSITSQRGDLGSSVCRKQSARFTHSRLPSGKTGTHFIRKCSRTMKW